MKELSGYLGIPVFLLVTTWGALSTALDVVARLNAIRDFVLGVSENGRAADPSLRLHVFYSDWVPLFFALLMALLIFAAVFCLIPPLFRALHRNSVGEEGAWAKALMEPVVARWGHLDLACYGMALMAIVACIAHIWGGVVDWVFIKERLHVIVI